MKTILAAITWIVLTFSSSAMADLKVVLITESKLPYNSAPSKYMNSPKRYSNSINKYSNSGLKPSNSRAKYENSPANQSNGRTGKRRLLLNKNGNYIYIGYYVNNGEGLVNFFTASGNRVFYSPPKTDAIFDGDKGGFAGTVLKRNGKNVLAVTEKGQQALVKKGVHLARDLSS